MSVNKELSPEQIMDLLNSGVIPRSPSLFRWNKIECYHCQKFEGLHIEDKAKMPKISLTIHRCWSALVLDTSREIIGQSRDLKKSCRMMEDSLQGYSAQCLLLKKIHIDFPLVKSSLDEEIHNEAEELLQQLNFGTIVLGSKYNEMCSLTLTLTEMLIYLCAMMTQIHMSFSRNRHHKLVKEELHSLKIEQIKPTVDHCHIINKKLVRNVTELVEKQLEVLRDSIERYELWEVKLENDIQACKKKLESFAHY